MSAKWCTAWSQRHQRRLVSLAAWSGKAHIPRVLTWIYSEGRPEVMEWLFLTPRQRGDQGVDQP